VRLIIELSTINLSTEDRSNINRLTQGYRSRCIGGGFEADVALIRGYFSTSGSRSTSVAGRRWQVRTRIKSPAGSQRTSKELPPSVSGVRRARSRMRLGRAGPTGDEGDCWTGIYTRARSWCGGPQAPDSRSAGSRSIGGAACAVNRAVTYHSAGGVGWLARRPKEVRDFFRNCFATWKAPSPRSAQPGARDAICVPLNEIRPASGRSSTRMSLDRVGPHSNRALQPRFMRRSMPCADCGIIAGA